MSVEIANLCEAQALIFGVAVGAQPAGFGRQSGFSSFLKNGVGDYTLGLDKGPTGPSLGGAGFIGNKCIAVALVSGAPNPNAIIRVLRNAADGRINVFCFDPAGVATDSVFWITVFDFPQG